MKLQFAFALLLSAFFISCSNQPQPEILTVVEQAIIIEMDTFDEDDINRWKKQPYDFDPTTTKPTLTVKFVRLGKDLNTFLPDHNWKTEKVLSYLSARGYRPITLRELASLKMKIKDLEKWQTLSKKDIIAIGSVWREAGFNDAFPVMESDQKIEYTNLMAPRWLEWDTYVFAVTETSIQL